MRGLPGRDDRPLYAVPRPHLRHGVSGRASAGPRRPHHGRPLLYALWQQVPGARVVAGCRLLRGGLSHGLPEGRVKVVVLGVGRVKVAVVGAGSIGRRHIDTLLSLGQDVVVVDPADPPLPNAVARRPRLADLRDCRAALICTPASERLPIIDELIDMGIDLFIEKPLALDLGQAKAIAELVATYPRRVVMMGYNLRFDPDLFRAVLRIRGMGRIAHARFLCSSYLPQWRAGRDYRDTPSAKASLGGGILREASHELDLVNWIFQPLLRNAEIAATLERRSELEIDVEDTAHIRVRIPNGPAIDLDLDFCTPGYRRSLTVVGDGPTIEWHLLNDSPMYRKEMEHFLWCVENRIQPRVGITDGLLAMALDHRIRTVAGSTWVAA